MLERLVASGKMTMPEKLALLDDLDALVEGGKLPAGDLLASLPKFLDGRNRHLVGQSARIAGELDEHLVPDALRPRYAKWIRKLFGDHARKLGLLAKKGDDDATKLTRTTVIDLVADEGEDAALAKEAGKLAGKWLDDRKAIPDESVTRVLAVAAAHGDAKLHARLVEALKKTKDRREQSRLLAALLGFRDPALIRKTQELAFTEGIQPKLALDLATAGIDHPRTRDAAWAFLMEKYDTVAERIPADWRRALIAKGASFCDAARRDEVRATFEAKAPQYPGGPRVLAQTLERIDLCIAARETQQASVEKFLSGK
jgi:alanyl aminopeptidase